MSKYNLKKDIKNISNAFTAIISILIIFLIFTFLILLPIYFFSKNYTNYYTLAVLFLLTLFFGYIVIKKSLKKWEKYKKLNLFSLDIFINLILPLLLIVLFFIIEAVIFRVFYEIFPFMYATLAVIGTNIVVFFLLFLSRRIFHNIKAYLKKNAL